MGMSLWLFGYLCMRQTQLNEAGEGLPRYGNPISTHDILTDTGWSKNQIKKWMCRLRRAGYIRTVRSGNDGVVIFIAKAKKKQRVQANLGSAKSAPSNSQVVPNQRRIGLGSRQTGTTLDANPLLNQAVAVAPTISLSYSETPSLLQHGVAPKTGALTSISEILRGKPTPKATPPLREMTEQEKQQRLRHLHQQAEQLYRIPALKR